MAGSVGSPPPQPAKRAAANVTSAKDNKSTDFIFSTKLLMGWASVIHHLAATRVSEWTTVPFEK